ncbi:M48 family metallopeptidase [Streptomyces sp. NPDC005820]|uniref:M48 family metallopeptidase n=1 Tax=Streptomyces sp. NPDC005820 TaxID=3157069 RepID=UPI0033F21D46
MDTLIPEPAERPTAVRQWLLGAALLAVGLLPAVVLGAVVLVVGLRWGPDWSLLAPLVLFWFGVTGAVARDRGPLPGRAVHPDDEPELAALVRDVADRLGFRAPLLVRIVPVVQASLGRVRVSGVRTHVLFLGLPLLRTLTEAELASVVAHELAHQRHVGSRRAGFLRYARSRLTDRLDARVRPLAPLAAPLLRASQPDFWRAETAADADAARVAGAAATAAALRRTVRLHAVFEGLGDAWLSDLAERDAWPEDFYDALDAALADPHVAHRAALAAAEEDAIDPYATADHPPEAVRLAALPALPGTGTYGGTPVTLRNAPEITRWCVHRLALQDGEDENDVEAVRLLDLPPDELRGLDDDSGTARLFKVTGHDTPEAAVRAALDTLADGTWPRLARRLEPGLRRVPRSVRAHVARTVCAAVVAGALAEVLETSGWTPATRWTDTVLTSPDGRTVDLRELLTEAVTTTDPTAVRALLPQSRPKETPA